MDPELELFLLDSRALILPQSLPVSLAGSALMEGILLLTTWLELLVPTTVTDIQQVLHKFAMNERREDVGAGGEGRVTTLLQR